METLWFCIENSDMCIVIHREKKLDTGQLFLAFRLLKRRYRSSEKDDRLRVLDYFTHPYAEGSDIRLIDDLESEESVSLTTLSSFDLDEVVERGKKNATEREQKKHKKSNDDEALYSVEYEPFDFGKSTYA